MLIRSIRAENFMRFSRLELKDLPQRGVIGIEGPNESGKSTVGEVLLFAFFGKTRLSSDAALMSLIRWGADSLSAEVEFSIPPAGRGDQRCVEHGSEYLIFRQIDRYGTNYVKVLELPARREVAAGNRQVADFISRSVKLDFHELLHSFYHDQYAERRTKAGAAFRPAPGADGGDSGDRCGIANQASFFECAAGTWHIRQATEDLKREIEPMEREFAYHQREIARNLAQIEKYDKNVVKIPDLAAREAKLSDSIADESRKSAELKRRAESLRAEAVVLDGRAKRLDQLPDALIEVFPAQVGKLLGGEEGALGRPSRLLEDEGFKASVRPVREGLEALRVFSSGLEDLSSLVRREHAEVSRRLARDAKDGPVADLANLEAEVASLARRASRKLWGALPAALMALGAGSLAYACLRHGLEAPVFWPESLKPSIGWQVGGLAVLALAVVVMRSRKVILYRRKRKLLLGSRARLGGEISALRRAEAQLSGLSGIQSVGDIPRFAAEAAACSIPPVSRAASDLRAKHPLFLDGKDGASFDKTLAAMAKADRDLRSRVLAEAQRLDKLAQEEENTQKRVWSEKERVESEIRECQSQASRKEALEGRNKELDVAAAGVRAEIDLWLLASRLMDETLSSVRSKIGPALTRFVKSILPRLTSGRYRDVRVESDLQLKVYSSEKNDFLGLHELSGGTSEALCLALRLAVSHAFTAARTRQPQFVFLDEPFKMMDAARAGETLRILPRLSPGLEQFFITQPNFSSDARDLLDFVIHTSHETAILETACPATPAELDPVGGHDPTPHAVGA